VATVANTLAQQHSRSFGFGFGFGFGFCDHI
jgi:hypothetical protein